MMYLGSGKLMDKSRLEERLGRIRILNYGFMFLAAIAALAGCGDRRSGKPLNVRVGYVDSGNIYIVDKDGGNIKQITSNGADSYPVFHPLNKKDIAFSRDNSTGTETELWVTDAEGNERQVTYFGARTMQADWNDMGDKLAVSTTYLTGVNHIATVDLNGNIVDIVAEDSQYEYFHPVWVGSEVTYEESDGRAGNLHMSTENGTFLGSLTNSSAGRNTEPKATYDGKKILWSHQEVPFGRTIWEMNWGDFSGTTARAVTPAGIGAPYFWNPAPNPINPNEFVAISDKDGTPQVYLENIVTGAETVLPNTQNARHLDFGFFSE